MPLPTETCLSAGGDVMPIFTVTSVSVENADSKRAYI